MPMTPTRTADDERFGFGDNWCSFANLVDETRVAAAMESLADVLPIPGLVGWSFLDIGCGSGLFSLAAHRLGAVVRSFDYDLMSAATTARLRDRFAPHSDWVVEPGSILDEDYTEGLGLFDVVYAWGVLHHTGDLWHAVDAAAARVAPGGTLFISVYNDQGLESRIWRRAKRRYNRSGAVVHRLLLAAGFLYLGRRRALNALARTVPGLRKHTAPRPVRGRGMSARHDLVDWVGGYPFEVAKPEEVFARVHRLGFELRRMKTCAGGIGCNEFVFERQEGTKASW